MKTENLAIILTDIVGYTEATSRLSRKEQKEMLNLHNQLLYPIIRDFGGKVVKTIGDALLLVFRSPTDAMLCSMAMQDALYDYNRKSHHGEELHIRIAASQGEVRVANKDVFGEPVNLTSRIESITPEDEIYLSDAIYLAMNKAEVPCVEVGMQQLKGIAQPVRIWKIPRFSTSRLVAEKVMDNEDLGELSYPFGGAHLTARSKESRAIRLPASKTAFVAGFLLLALVAGGAVLLTRPSDPGIDQPVETRVPDVSSTAPAAAGEPAPTQNDVSPPAKTAGTVVKKAEPEPVVVKGSAPVRLKESSPPPNPNAKLIAQLGSDQGDIMRTAARQVARMQAAPADVLAAIEQGLERHYQSNNADRVMSDALAWYCKILGQSADPAYLPILEKIASSAGRTHLKKYAAKSLEQLKSSMPK